MSSNPRKFDENIKAECVYDGGDTLKVPAELWPDAASPEEAAAQVRDKGQLLGTIKETLCELAGRCCYDSLGQGRDSAQYWEHIRGVKHLSVVEHAYFTVQLKTMKDADFVMTLAALMNRRGVWVSFDMVHGLRVTLNVRALLEWKKWSDKSFGEQSIGGPILDFCDRFGNSLYVLIQPMVPLILPWVGHLNGQDSLSHTFGRLIEPIGPHENHISMYLAASRGDSHEQVRHRENISQRSTRYVDEDGSPWVQHPLIAAYVAATGDDEIIQLTLDTIGNARGTYSAIVAKLQPWLSGRGVDKLTARKQARGAARGYLGNALKTAMIFTTSVDGWREILFQRLNGAADAEIRWKNHLVLQELRKGRFADYFADLKEIPAKDGLGFELEITK